MRVRSTFITILSLASVGLITVAFVMADHAGLAQTQTNTPSLDLRVKSEKPAYILGEAVKLRFELENKGKVAARALGHAWLSNVVCFVGGESLREPSEQQLGAIRRGKSDALTRRNSGRGGVDVVECKTANSAPR